jgi:hypothetical protein
MLGVQDAKVSDFNALNFLDLIWSSPCRTARILIPPEGTGRAHVRRPMRLWGVVEREAFVGGLWVDAFATALGRFLATQDETQAAEDRQAQQARAEIAHAVQDAPTSCPSGASIGAG